MLMLKQIIKLNVLIKLLNIYEKLV